MLFFLYGDNDYCSEEKLKKIKNKFIREIDESGYNIVVLDEKITIERFTKEIFQTGFLASRKLIIIKNIFEQQLSKELIKTILNYLEKLKIKEELNKDKKNIIVFYENNNPQYPKYSQKNKKTLLSGDKLKLFQTLKSFKYSQESKKLANYKIAEWIQVKFKENNKNISKELADKLFALIGNNLRFLNNEIIKISNYNNKNDISEESINKLTSSTLNEDIFLFSDKLANKKKTEAIHLLNDQLRSGVAPIYLLAMITRQFRILLQIKSALNNKIKQSDLAKHLSIHPFIIKKNIAFSQKYSLADLKLIYHKLLSLDQDIKYLNLKPEILLNLFVLNL